MNLTVDGVLFKDDEVVLENQKRDSKIIGWLAY